MGVAYHSVMALLKRMCQTTSIGAFIIKGMLPTSTCKSGFAAFVSSIVSSGFRGIDLLKALKAGTSLRLAG